MLVLRAIGAGVLLVLLTTGVGGQQPQTPTPLADIMRETDAAYQAIRAGDLVTAPKRFSNASKLLDTLTSDRSQTGRSAVFAQRWYELVVNTHIAAGRTDDARQLLQRALTLYPRCAPLFVARGSITEMSAALERPDLRGRDADSPSISEDIPGSSGRRRSNRDQPSQRLEPGAARYQLSQRLAPAAAEYRHALDLDPHLALARLHLGWVHLLEGDERSRDEFTQALADATTPRDQYLAHLFLGAWAEARRDWVAALRHYEAARQIDPTWQTAYVSTSHVQVMLGHDEAARELAHAAAGARGASAQDPWWAYRLGGVDEALLQWLHEEAERP